ncbi:MAG: hypothetical protein ACTTKL_09030 [Treponema sp.]
MPDFLDKIREEDFLIQQKTELRLKQLGLDKNHIEEAFRRLEELQTANADLTRKVDEQAKRIDGLETESRALKKSVANAAETILSSHAADNTEVQTTIETLEPELQRLQEEKKSLEDEINALKTQQIGLQKQYKEWEAMLTRKQNDKSDGCIHFEIPCTEENLFFNEIPDYLYSLLYEMLEKEKANLPENKRDEANRKRDIVANLLENRKFD